MTTPTPPPDDVDPTASVTDLATTRPAGPLPLAEERGDFPEQMSILIATVPYWLRQVPSEDLIVVPVRDHQATTPIVRMDVRAGEWAYTPHELARVGRTLRDASDGRRPDSVVALAVTSDPETGQVALDRLRMHLGLPAIARVVADDNGTWREIDTGHTGHVTDTLRAQTASRYPGEPTPPTKAEITRLFTPTPNDALGSRIAATAGEWEQRTFATREAHIAERDWVATTVAQGRTGVPLTDTQAARLLLGMGTDKDLRDHAISDLTVTNTAGHPELWADLTRRAPEAYRTAPAAMAALAYWADRKPIHARAAYEQIPHNARHETLPLIIDRMLQSNPHTFLTKPIDTSHTEWPRPPAMRLRHHATPASADPPAPRRPQPNTARHSPPSRPAPGR